MGFLEAKLRKHKTERPLSDGFTLIERHNLLSANIVRSSISRKFALTSGSAMR